MGFFSRTIAGLCLVLSIGSSVNTRPSRGSPQLNASPQAPLSAAPVALAPAAPPPEARTVTGYTLPPDLARKAHRLGQIAFWGQLGGFLYSVIALLLLLTWRVVPRIRDWAERATSVRLVQASIVAPAFFLAFDVLWGFRQYGLSIQRWGSWFWDWTKRECVTVIVAALLT
jgi:hypothetical protein